MKKLISIFLILTMCMSLFTGFTTVDIAQDAYSLEQALYQQSDIDVSFDVGLADIETRAYTPGQVGNGSVNLSASVQFPAGQLGQIGYADIYMQGPGSNTFVKHNQIQYGTYSSSSKFSFQQGGTAGLHNATTYSISYPVSGLKAGIYKFQFKFYTSDTTFSPMYSRVVTVIISPEILNISKIADVTLTQGVSTPVTFTHKTNGDVDKISYIWHFNGVPHYVSDTPTFNLQDLEPGQYTGYCQIILDVGMSAKTNSFNVMVNSASVEGIIITTQPNDLTFSKGSARSVRFAVAEPDKLSRSQWYVNDKAVEGATSDELDLSKLDVGTYQVYNEFVLGDETMRTRTSTVRVTDGAVTPEPSPSPTTPSTTTPPTNKPIDKPTNNIFLWIGGGVVLCLLLVFIFNTKHKRR